MKKITSIVLQVVACVAMYWGMTPQKAIAQTTEEKQVNPVILYSTSTPRSYEIGGISVSGIKKLRGLCIDWTFRTFGWTNCACAR